MSKDKTLLALKNIIHNDLGVTRIDIMELAKDCIHDIVERQVRNIFQETKNSLEDKVNKAMDKEVRRIVEDSSWSGKRKIVEGIAKAIRSQLIITIRENKIKGN